MIRAALRGGGVRVLTRRVVATAPPTLPGSRPRSARDLTAISFERALMMPFSDGYRGSPSAWVQTINAGIGASRTSYPVGLIRRTRTVPAAGSGSMRPAYERNGALRIAA